MGCGLCRLQPTDCIPDQPERTRIQRSITPQQALSIAQLEETIANGRQLVPAGYDAKDLLSLIEKHNLVRIKERVVDPFLLRILQDPVPSQPNNEELTRTLLEWYEFFDEVFFFGSVRRHRPFRINLVKKSPSPKADELGHYTTAMITLYLDAHEHLKEQFNGKVLHVMISTLLHEMLHAFMCNYSFYQKEEGEHEHGPTFCNILAILEERLSCEVDFRVDCGVWRSGAVSMIIDYWRASEADMKRWGASDDALRSLSPGGEYHDPHSAESEELRKQMLEADS